MQSQELRPKPKNFLGRRRWIFPNCPKLSYEWSDERNFFGVQNLAKNLEFAELVKFLERQHGKFLTRVPELHLARDTSGQVLLWRARFWKSFDRLKRFVTGQKNYFIDLKTGLSDQVLKTLNVPANSQLQITSSLGITPQRRLSRVAFLWNNKEFDHFKKSPGTSHFIFLNGKNYILN